MKHLARVIVVVSLLGSSALSLSMYREPQDGQYYYLRHEFSGKYVCSGDVENGGNVWLWGPIPPDHEARYKFKLISAGGGYYYLRHEFSGKYVCSGEQRDGGKLWLWSPIPAGHEPRYRFKLISTGSGYYY